MCVIDDVGGVGGLSDDGCGDVEIGRTVDIGVEDSCSDRYGVDQCVRQCLYSGEGNDDSGGGVDEIVVDDINCRFIGLACSFLQDAFYSHSIESYQPCMDNATNFLSCGQICSQVVSEDVGGIHSVEVLEDELQL